MQAVTTKPAPLSLEETNAIQLYYEFNEKRFAVSLRNLNVVSLLLTKYQTSTDSFVLLEKLIEEDKIKILVSLAVNNVNTLLNIPFDKLLNCIKQNIDKSDAHQKAYDSLSTMSSVKQGIEKIMRIIDRNSTGPVGEGCTAAHLEALWGSCRNLSKLQKIGCDLNKTNDKGHTVAYMVARSGIIEDLMILKDLGVDFEKGVNGAIPANIAVIQGQEVVIRLLKNWGVQFDKPNQNGSTPIHTAAFYGNTTLLKLFHGWGLNMDILNKDGHPPIHQAALNSKTEVLELFYSLGLKLDTQAKDGTTIAHLAARDGNMAVLQLLHDRKEKLDAPDHNNNTPAHYATIKDQLEVLVAFQRWEVDLDTSMSTGATIMYLAASKGFLDIIKFLIDKRPNQAKIPAIFNASLFYSLMTELHEDKEIESRLTQKLKERKLAGDPDSKTKIFPLDIAEIMGHVHVVEELQKLAQKETRAIEKRSGETVDSTEKENAPPTDNSLIVTNSYCPNFFATSKESNSDKPLANGACISQTHASF
ncbi:ankyrin repeat domain-containing protein [Legionella drozanskii]|uniref:ankyrin repeat domain-containing protein n=1 Tax=Legionella drozanskii TaxID=96228 RepID=UPI00104198CD|nr:ankyrin repeat domain-containing protein [Legionella drozanskii]